MQRGGNELKYLRYLFVFLLGIVIIYFSVGLLEDQLLSIMICIGYCCSILAYELERIIDKLGN